MADEMVIAMYRPHEGKDAELLEIIARHMPALRAEGLVTDRPAQLMRASDGTYLEIFQWKDGGAHAAHTNEVVMEVWNAMGAVADFPPLASLAEAQSRFPHFEAVDGVSQ